MNPPKAKRNAHMAELYRSGWTLLDIGKFYGVSDTRVYQILRRAGVQTRPRGHHMRAA